MRRGLVEAVESSDYEAAHAMVSALIEDSEFMEREGKLLLSELYRRGTPLQRKCLVHGVLEHLLEIDRFARLFADWEQDTELSVPLSEALRWASDVKRRRELLLPVAIACAEELRRTGFTTAEVQPAALGTDSVAIQWRDLTAGELRVLVLECTDDLIAKFPAGQINGVAVESLARQAADPQNWKSDDHVPWQYWIALAPDS
jgi:hypothetical protein